MIESALLRVMLWCARTLGFGLVVFPKDGEYVKVIHLARDEVVLERSMREWLGDLGRETSGGSREET